MLIHIFASSLGIVALELAVCALSIFQIVDLGYNVRNGAVRWQVSASINFITVLFFVPTLTVSEMLTLQTFYCENAGQGH